MIFQEFVLLNKTNQPANLPVDPLGGLAELVDAPDLKSGGIIPVRVRLPRPLLTNSQ